MLDGMGSALCGMMIGTIIIFTTGFNSRRVVFWKLVGVLCLMVGTYRLVMVLAELP